MKKLTTLQIIMLMHLAVGSSALFSDAGMLELQSTRDQAATLPVLEDLAITSPKSLDQIVADLAHLEEKLSSVKEFIEQKNKEIDNLLEQKSAAEEDIAVLAVELAQAQATFEKVLAEQQVQRKSKNKHQRHKQTIQAIKDGLMKAEQGLKILNNNAMASMRQAARSMNKMVAGKAHRGGVRKPFVKKEDALQASQIPGVQDAVAQRIAEENNISVEQANMIIDNALADDSMNDEVVVQSLQTPSQAQQNGTQNQQQRQARRAQYKNKTGQ